MVAFKVAKFGGMVPAVADRLLPEAASAHAENTWLYSGELIGMHAPTFLRACVGAAIGKVFRIPNNYTDTAHIGDSVWMEFTNPDTDVLRAAVVGDTFDRYYWVSPTTSPTYNTKARIAAGSAAYTLGLLPPPTAPAVVASGGVSTIVSARSYVITRVSAYGEEGPPSPATVLTGKQDDTWAVTLAAMTSPENTARNLTLTRIYRTVTGASGVAQFFLVKELAVATLTWNDTASDALVSENSILESTNWAAPPSDLQGFVSMPNGIIAGFRDNEIWFCEPYRPHAWPAAYALAIDFPIVGLGVVNQTLVACTVAFPVAVTGTHPSVMTQSKLTQLEPCLSRGGILSTPEGVYYPSPNGLILVASGMAANITIDLATKDKWQNVAPLSTLRAARMGVAYYGFGSSRPGSFDPLSFDMLSFAKDDFVGSFSGLLIDPQRVGYDLALSTLGKGATLAVLSNAAAMVNVFNDPWTGEVLIIRDNNVYWLNIGDTAPTYESYIWRSKIFQTPDKKNLAVMRVYFSTPSTAPALNPTRKTDLVQTLQADQWGLVRVYADDVLVTTRELRTSGELMRIVSDRKSDFWQIEFEARVRVESVQAGTSVKGLKDV